MSFGSFAQPSRWYAAISSWVTARTVSAVSTSISASPSSREIPIGSWRRLPMFRPTTPGPLSAAFEADESRRVRPRHRDDVCFRNPGVPQLLEEPDEAMTRAPEAVAEAVVGGQRASVRADGIDSASEHLRACAEDVQGRDILTPERRELDGRSEVGEFDDLRIVEVWPAQFLAGVCHQHLLVGRECLRHGMVLFGGDVPGREDGARLLRQRGDLVHLVDEDPVIVEAVDWFSAKADPVRLPHVLAPMDRRQPHDARSL